MCCFIPGDFAVIEAVYYALFTFLTFLSRLVCIRVVGTAFVACAAFLGRLHPVGVLFGGLLLALTYLGGEKAQIDLGMPNAVTGIFQGILLFYLLACDVLILYRVRIGQRVPAAKAA